MPMKKSIRVCREQLNQPLDEINETFCARCMNHNIETRLYTVLDDLEMYYWFWCYRCNCLYPNIKKNEKLFPIQEPKLSHDEIQKALSPEIPKKFVCYCERYCTMLPSKFAENLTLVHCANMQCHYRFSLRTGKSPSELAQLATIRKYFKIIKPELELKKQELRKELFKIYF